MLSGKPLPTKVIIETKYVGNWNTDYWRWLFTIKATG
jgi:hypothetical protein